MAGYSETLNTKKQKYRCRRWGQKKGRKERIARTLHSRLTELKMQLVKL